ncbi:MAG: PorT family protein [Bacteroidetes bacterium]|nr:PorT family protein [Bacteroidota bacterium]
MLVAAHSYGQLVNSVFLNNSYICFGGALSTMKADPIYDLDLSSLSFGVFYRLRANKKWHLEPGIALGTRGGRSFTENTYQTFGYLDFPVLANMRLGQGFHVALGIQPSILLNHAARIQGVRTPLEVNPFTYAPNPYDLSALAQVQVSLSPRTSLSLLSGYSLVTSTAYPSLHFLHHRLQISFSLAQPVGAIEKVITAQKRRNDFFLDLADHGYVLVALDPRDQAVEYFMEARDTATAQRIARETPLVHNALIMAFKAHFSFCTTYFIDENDLYRVFSGNLDGIKVLDNNGNEQMMSELADKPFAIFMPGDIFAIPNTVSRSGYHFIDHKGNNLYDPFPTQGNISIIGRDEFHRMVKSLNSRLGQTENNLRERTKPRKEQ